MQIATSYPCLFSTTSRSALLTVPRHSYVTNSNSSGGKCIGAITLMFYAKSASTINPPSCRRSNVLHHSPNIINNLSSRIIPVLSCLNSLFLVDLGPDDFFAANMKASVQILAFFGCLATAQRMSDALPECAVECLENGIESATDCSVDDGDCICEVDNYRNTYDVSQACVLQSCGAARSLGASTSGSSRRPHFPVDIFLHKPTKTIFLDGLLLTNVNQTRFCPLLPGSAARSPTVPLPLRLTTLLRQRKPSLLSFLRRALLAAL